jgi:hypothetical protein
MSFRPVLSGAEILGIINIGFPLCRVIGAGWCSFTRFLHSSLPDLTMPIYRFAMHLGAAETEELGFMRLLDDAEAVDLAKRVIHDMPEEDRTDGRSLGITDGKRAVAYISCDINLAA